jgi:hypothetical protein
MQQQVKVLRSSDGGGGGVDEAPGKRKRACPAADRDGEEDEAAQEEEETLKKQCENAATAVAEASGIEVELHTQSPLPEDWEQFLDLKVAKKETRSSAIPVS